MCSGVRLCAQSLAALHHNTLAHQNQINQIAATMVSVKLWISVGVLISVGS